MMFEGSCSFSVSDIVLPDTLVPEMAVLEVVADTVTTKILHSMGEKEKTRMQK